MTRSRASSEDASSAAEGGLVTHLPTALTDRDLVERASDGDRWASGALYRRHLRPLAATVARLLASTQDVEDLVHDAFVESLRKLHTLRDPEAYGSWVRQIAIARVRTLLRRRRVARRLGLHQPCEDASLAALADPSLSPDALADLHRLDEILAVLSAEERLVWMLRHVEGESTHTIAVALQRSTATVKRRLASAERRVDRHARGSR